MNWSLLKQGRMVKWFAFSKPEYKYVKSLDIDLTVFHPAFITRAVCG
jgi:hypothetical protein